MAWYEEAVFYHIYPLGLLGAPEYNEHCAPTHRLQELQEWIFHMKDCGFTALYLGPCSSSGSHGYDTSDYRKVDERLGDNNDLKEFVRMCHNEGIRVILDGVFNHTGREFFAFQDLKENREGSRYRNWYSNVNFWGNNSFGDGFSYDNWGGHDLLPKLNLYDPEVRNYHFDTIRFWVSEFDIDGVRLDAADVLEQDFMRELRGLAGGLQGGLKEDFWLMGEVIHGEYGRWVNEHALHSVTNYALHKAQNALWYGEYREMDLTNTRYAFMRGDVLITVTNSDAEEWFDLELDGSYVGALHGREIGSDNGRLKFTLEGNSAEIWIPA